MQRPIAGLEPGLGLPNSGGGVPWPCPDFEVQVARVPATSPSITSVRAAHLLSHLQTFSHPHGWHPGRRRLDPSFDHRFPPQGSGKSFLASMLEKEGVVVASNDRTGGKEKTLRLADHGLMSGKSVVIDNTHVDKEARKPFIDLAKKYKVVARCFQMTTTHDHAR